MQIIEDDGPTGELSLLAVDRVMCRYGRPLDHGVALEGDSLVCGKYRLRRLRYHAIVDAEGRDYLVWERPDGEPLACVAAYPDCRTAVFDASTSLASALRNLRLEATTTQYRRRSWRDRDEQPQ